MSNENINDLNDGLTDEIILQASVPSSTNCMDHRLKTKAISFENLGHVKRKIIEKIKAKVFDAEYYTVKLFSSPEEKERLEEQGLRTDLRITTTKLNTMKKEIKVSLEEYKKDTSGVFSPTAEEMAENLGKMFVKLYKLNEQREFASFKADNFENKAYKKAIKVKANSPIKWLKNIVLFKMMKESVIDELQFKKVYGTLDTDVNQMLKDHKDEQMETFKVVETGDNIDEIVKPTEADSSFDWNTLLDQSDKPLNNDENQKFDWNSIIDSSDKPVNIEQHQNFDLDGLIKPEVQTIVPTNVNAFPELEKLVQELKELDSMNESLVTIEKQKEQELKNSEELKTITQKEVEEKQKQYDIKLAQTKEILLAKKEKALSLRRDSQGHIKSLEEQIEVNNSIINKSTEIITKKDEQIKQLDTSLVETVQIQEHPIQR
ncbi:MAG: hypothetical protein RR359_00800 [Bacilli bacterium]